MGIFYSLFALGAFNLIVAIPRVDTCPRWMDFVCGGSGVFLMVVSLRAIMS